MKIWQDLVKPALVGTGRRAGKISVGAAAPSLRPLLAQIDFANQAQALWQAAGVVALWQKSGYQPHTAYHPAGPG